MLKSYIDVEVLRQLIEKRGIEVNELAQRMKVAPSTVNRLLSSAEKRPVSTIFLFDMARALNVDIPTIIYKKI